MGMHNCLVEEKRLEQINFNGGRLYRDKSGIEYTSVTSFLGSFNKDAIDNWRRSVGEEAANRISGKAARLGTRIHAYCESFLQDSISKQYSLPLENKLKNTLRENPTEMNMFYSLRNRMQESVTNVYGIEIPLHSRTLGLAGTADLFCKWDGEPTIVDFKTSRRKKKKEWIENYFLQGTAYAMMAREMYNTDIYQIVIIIANPEDSYPQTFIENPENWKEKLLTMKSEYDSINSVNRRLF
tara:strand:+ start:2069 stop:2788 length:720 start_codon:yes stop_codon:yes gene_type:complete